MDNFYWLDQIQTSDRAFVGEQAFYLSSLLQKGYPVIPGFVISGEDFRDFLGTINWLDPLFADLSSSSLYIDIENSRQLQEIARQIRQSIQSAPFSDERLAQIDTAVKSLRSSVVMLRPSLSLRSGIVRRSVQVPGFNELRGLLETQICWNEPESVAQSLKNIWSEIFRARNLFYWQRLGIQLQTINLAVLVQPAYPAISAGTVQVRNTTFTIQASWGLGVALMRGEVSPDVYQVQADSSTVLLKQLGYKTLAYQITEAAPAPARVAEACIQPYSLSEEQQRQSALTETQLQALIQFTRTLVAELGSTLAFEWVLDVDKISASPRLHLTQIDPLYLAGRRSETQSRARSGTSRFLSGSSQQSTLSAASTPEIQKQLLAGTSVGRGRAIATAKVFTNPIKIPINIASGAILVLPFVTPDWLPLIKRSAGIITEQGGMTSHGAILARELGIPAIVGAVNATQLIRNGDRILLDSDRGEISRLEPAPPAPLNAVSDREMADQTANYLLPMDTTPAVSDLPITGTQLFVNLSQIESLEIAAKYPLDGVGLLRAELMAISALDQQHPSLWLKRGQQVELVDRLINHISQFAKAFFPQPVFYRSFDLRTHEFQGLEGGDALPVETNPMLGMRGTLSYQRHPELFELELLALAQIHQQGYDNVHLLLPFVRTVEEFTFCRQRVEQAGLLHNHHFQLWLMAEVPSMLLLLPDYVKAGAQGISIGSNDLTQLILGIDRDRPQMAQGLDERHPAVLRAIAHLIRTARQYQIPCSICGQAPAQYPEIIDHLVRWGISSISVDLNAVESTHRAIARAEQRLLLERNCDPPREELS
ncbi:MAG: hypothetical protein KME16_25470 [Scytolyngbya sp. HA4215-MV1]|nr:hypothetical protein [Scytolyngbya sp. HA4215-MV1]